MVCRGQLPRQAEQAARSNSNRAGTQQRLDVVADVSFDLAERTNAFCRVVAGGVSLIVNQMLVRTGSQQRLRYQARASPGVALASDHGAVSGSREETARRDFRDVEDEMRRRRPLSQISGAATAGAADNGSS